MVGFEDFLSVVPTPYFSIRSKAQAHLGSLRCQAKEQGDAHAV